MSAPRTSKNEHTRPGDILQVVHAFAARSGDELTLSRGDRIELIEKDDDFGDGWYLGKHLQNGSTGLFPEVYTQPAPKPTLSSRNVPRTPITEVMTQSPVDIDAASKETLKSTAQQTPAPVAGTAPGGDAKPASTPNLPTEEPSSTAQPLPLQTAPNGLQSRTPVPTTAAVPRSISMTLAGEVGSPVMNETLSVIDEHITDMHTPRHSVAGHDRRAANDSGSEYSSHFDRLSYINGEETDEEESAIHTEAEVLTWSAQRVAEYLEAAGLEKRHCNVFKEQEINGEALMALDQPTIFLKEFDLGPVGPRLRTWMRIKALQQEIKSGGVASTKQNVIPGDTSSDRSRNRSVSTSTVLPRIPSLSQGPGSRTPTRQPANRMSATPSLQPSPRGSHPYAQSSGSGAHTPNARESTPPLAPAAPGHAHRPSAASIRSLNHNRRHSALEPATSPFVDHIDGFEGAPSKSHKKEPSFDRTWTMAGSGPRSADSLRPSSSRLHSHSQSTTAAAFDATSPAERELSSADVDRGYFSGNEVENRRSIRNVLRKRESESHSRKASYKSEASQKAAEAKRHSRIGSVDSVREPVSSMSAAAWAYYQPHRKSTSKRNNTVPLLDHARPLTKNESPTITKLEYGLSSSNGAVTSSPKDSSSMGRASPSPVTSGGFFKKSRIGGLRAISDAITGHEKANYAPSTDSTLVASPLKDSPLQSPTRTGSTTPTTATKSFEIDDGEKSKRTTTSSTGTPAVPKRRNKKATSAYLRGLEQKTPAEQIAGCDYSGWMKKKSSNLMTTYKPRLFVLKGRRLSYYYSESDTEEKGLIDISSHRVLPANEEKLTGLHASVTRAASSPSSPNNATITTTAAIDAAKEAGLPDDSGSFIFKLVPPRNGISRGVNFTKPTVHYFAVDNIVQGRLWMAALMKATIDKDPDAQVLSTYKDKTISLAKAMRRKERPPALMVSDGEDDATDTDKKSPDDKGLAISGLDEKADSGVGDEKNVPNDSTESTLPSAETKEISAGLDQSGATLVNPTA